jgi:hypothetical protein
MKILTIKSALKVAALATASLFSLTSLSAKEFEATLTIREPTTEGGIDWAVLNSDDFNLGTVDSTHSEYLKVSGTTAAKLPGDEDKDNPTIHWGVLLESDGIHVSDILKLSIDNGKTGNDPASVIFEMWSDGATDFSTVLAGLPAGIPTLKETGEAQEVVSKFLVNDNSTKLQIFVTSDVEPDGIPGEGDPGTLPEGSLPDGGATMLLLGGGISALALLRRKLS